ncbi:MAG: FAD-dependent oxidoreductase [Quadrisphaera sp.]
MTGQPPVPAGGRARPRVVVVGGGISGLAAAWALAAEDVDVVLLEAAPRVGGPLQTAELAAGTTPVTVDVGAESLLARRPEAVELAREVGLARDLVQPATTRAAVVLRGQRHPVPRGTVMGVPADPASMAGLLTAVEVARAADERLTEPLGEDGDVDVASFVAARLGSAVVDALVEPLLGGRLRGARVGTVHAVGAARAVAGGARRRLAARGGARRRAGLAGGVLAVRSVHTAGRRRRSRAGGHGRRRRGVRRGARRRRAAAGSRGSVAGRAGR